MKESSVQCWSTDDVIIWLKQHIPLEEERMEECLSAFQNEAIDGLRLLSLQRSSHACSGMTDSEWLLLHAARETLITCEGTVGMLSESHLSSLSPSSPKSCSEEHLEDENFSLYEPSRLQKSLTLETAQKSGSLLSYFKFLSLPRHLWSPSSRKHDQKEPTAAEVFSLQEEVLSAEEHAASLKAKMDYLDEILRTARLASYLYTRIRWTPLPGELPVDDADVDDWLQRFLVLEGLTLFFYPQAADFRPQGAILLKEVVDIGSISGQLRHEQDKITWFGFRVTTSEGLCLECATPMKLQAELWMSSLQDARAEQHPEDVNDGDLSDGHIM
eukprot:c18844_g1_i2 orf=211-1197(+)